MCNFIMICDTIGYCLYWDFGRLGIDRVTPMVTANTLAVLACALPQTASLLGLSATPCWWCTSSSIYSQQLCLRQQGIDQK